MIWATGDRSSDLPYPAALFKRRYEGADTPGELQPRDQSAEREAVRRRLILIVEDNHDGRLMLEDMLRLEGCEVVSAQNGREALDLLQQGILPSLILLDLFMPEMSGWEFRRRQRQDPAIADIPVIVTSAVATRSEAERSDLEAAAFLDKPVPPARLIELIRRFT